MKLDELLEDECSSDLESCLNNNEIDRMATTGMPISETLLNNYVTNEIETKQDENVTINFDNSN